MIRIGLYVCARTWRAFRLACLQHNISASQQVQALLEAQLEVWAEEERTRTDVPPL